ncbi:MAG: hypothetical protein FWG11_00110 [Promicromonosporaceae bacterium]|nr:hypothetical protein [Promicromonosporaceae bacterium]
MTATVAERLFYTERELAEVLGVTSSTLCRLAHAGKSPVEPIYVTPSTRRYPCAEVERLAGVSNERQQTA